MNIGQSAFDLIVTEEVSSKAYYERHYTHPEWPGGVSGITIAIGYDLGYATKAKILADWSSRVTPDILSLLLHCAGVTGIAAERMLPDVQQHIVIPWVDALAVFATRDIPQWTATVVRLLPNCDKLSATCLGVIVSVAYNRGASFNNAGDRYTEMRDIKGHMGGMMFGAIPADIESMKRLWPNVQGLRDRRDREAALFTKGLNPKFIDIETPNVGPTPVLPDPGIATRSGSARTKPPAATTAQHSTAGAIVAGSVLAAHTAGYGPGTVFVAGLVGAIVASVVWWFWYQERNPK